MNYEYKLSGYDQKWSSRSHLNNAKYPKLADGIYVFKVRSYNSDGIVGNEVYFTRNNFNSLFLIQFHLKVVL